MNGNEQLDPSEGQDGCAVVPEVKVIFFDVGAVALLVACVVSEVVMMVA